MPEFNVIDFHKQCKPKHISWWAQRLPSCAIAIRTSTTAARQKYEYPQEHQDSQAGPVDCVTKYPRDNLPSVIAVPSRPQLELMRQCWSILMRVKRGMLEIEINWNDQTLIRKLTTSTRGYLPEMVDSNPTVYDVE